MKVAGFSFIRNAIQYDYPIVEALQSILNLCDYVVVAVGQSDDATLELIKSIDPDKIIILETVWDDSKRQNGEVLAIETNKAFDAIREDADWCIYIQGDEMMLDAEADIIKKGMLDNLDNPKVEGLLFKYRHFYGSYDFVADSRQWYRREVRIIRNDKSIRSYKDAQGFRKYNQKLNVKLLDAHIHHYGWVRHPEAQQQKQRNFNRYWHSDQYVEKQFPASNFDYSQIDSLQKFQGTHPKVMQARIEKMNWTFDFDPSKNNLNTKEKLSRIVEKISGIRPGEYRNYILVK